MSSAATSRTRYHVLTMLCLAAAIAYICRNSVSVLESTIRAELGLSKTQSAWMMSLFFLTYAFGQLPTSMASVRFGNRRSLAVIAYGWSLATGMMTLALSLPMLLASRLLNGIAQAGIFPSTTMVISRWFPKTQRAIASGAIASAMSIGGALGVAITGYLLLFLDWRIIFALFSLLGVLWSAAFLVWFRDDPDQHEGVSSEELALIQHGREARSSEEDRHEPIMLGKLLLSPATFWISAQQLFRSAGYIFFASWFATYLQEARGVSRSTSGILNSLPLLAVVVGAWSGGYLSDWILRRTGSIRLARKAVAVTCMLVCAGFTLLSFFILDPIWASVAISVGSMCASVGGPCAYTITMDLGGRQVAPLFAIMNMVGNLGAFAFIQGVGPFLDFAEARGWGLQGWNVVFLSFVLSYILAAVCWMMLRTDLPAVEQRFRFLGKRNQGNDHGA